MSSLPALRRNIELMPSPLPERPGLLLRDPYRYSDAVIIVPPPLVPCLMLFDGSRSELDLREALVRVTGEVQVGELMDHLVRTLSGGGFLDDTQFAALKQDKEDRFARAPQREAVHAGSAYPLEPERLAERLRGYMDAAAGTGVAAGPGGDALVGIAAPHVSPDGGWRAYRAAYAALASSDRERTFVILGTSHYGMPERFGLTRKPFVTPLGETSVDLELVDELAREGGAAVCLEDYCHAVEHSVEFQVVFLQHLFGAAIRIVPVLCGPFARATLQGGTPEDDEGVARFLDALAGVAARQRRRLLFVLGIDMAHIGRRYGDEFSARASKGRLVEVARKDHRRIERALSQDASGFWEEVQAGADDLRWCGASPLYTFLKAVPFARGELLCYDQWNIDPRSVVSFAGLAFWDGRVRRRPQAASGAG